MKIQPPKELIFYDEELDALIGIKELLNEDVPWGITLDPELSDFYEEHLNYPDIHDFFAQFNLVLVGIL